MIRLLTAILVQIVILFPAVDTTYSNVETDDEQVRCLALTLYWEAREGGRDAMLPVGWVILNRRNHPDFPDTICAVVREGGEKPGCQFSYWCDGQSDVPQNSDSWKLAREVATELLTSPPRDPTGGALFFHSDKLKTPWTVERKRLAQIGGHVFYR